MVWLTVFKIKGYEAQNLILTHPFFVMISNPIFSYFNMHIQLPREFKGVKMKIQYFLEMEVTLFCFS